MEHGKAANTHRLYDTIDYEHLDSLVNWAAGEFPSSGLIVVECKDGHWFVEVDFGIEFNDIEGISKPDISPFNEPTFFDSQVQAREFAIKCIKQVTPSLENRNLSEYFADED